MAAEPSPRQDVLDGLSNERFGLPTRPNITPGRPVGPGPTTDLVARAKLECERRRARVLAHPDIAHRLTQHPLRYAQPQQWTGYIPGATYNGDQRNDSQRRTALLQIMTAVENRERAAPQQATTRPDETAPPGPDPVWDYDPPDPREEDM